MKLTVLGSSGAWPERGRACSGFLLESQEARLVLDLGFGTLPRLLGLCSAEKVDAVFVTHSHPDHCVDLYGLYRARALPEPPFAPLPIYALPEVMDRVGGLGGPGGPESLRRGTEYHEVGADQQIDIGAFRLTTFALPHFVPNLGVRVEAEGRVVAYTGDTGPSDRIPDVARKADLFVCEATYQGSTRPAAGRMLLTASEAGGYARAADARRLLLTHFWPGDNRDISRAEASQQFAGEVLLAEEGLAVTLS